jgi:hypothetical protein
MLIDPVYAPTFTAIASIAACVSALISLVAVTAAWRAVRANQRAFEAKLLSDLIDEYASAEMTASIEAVTKHLDDPNERLLDTDRRKVSHYFQKIYRLHKEGFIQIQMARAAVDAGKAALFSKMKPLEDEVRREKNLPVVAGDDPLKFYAELHR